MLIAAYAAAVAACVGLPAWFSHLEYQSALEAAQMQTRSYARALDEHVNRTLANAELTLEGVADLVASLGGLDTADPARLHARLEARARRLPELGTLFIYGPDLAIRFHSGSATPERGSGTALEHVAAHRDGRMSGLFIGRPLVGPATGIETVPLTVALRGAQGELQGVIGGALDLRYFDRFYRSLGLPVDAAISIVRTDGTLLVRYPAGVLAPGASLAASPLMRDAGSGPGEGTFEGAYREDGVPRIAAWRRNAERPLLFVVSRTRDGALAPWRAAVPNHVLAAVVALLAVSLLAFALRLGERRRAAMEASRRASEARFATFFRTNPLAGAISSRDSGRFVDVNEAWTRLFGVAREAAIGRTAVELGVFDPAERARVVQAIDARPGATVDAVMLDAKGARIDARLHAQTLTLEGERCILALIEDVTAARGAESALRASERRFAAFFRSSPAAHAMVRRSDGAHIEVSDGWLLMFRMTREAAQGRTAEALAHWVHPEARAAWVARLEREGRLTGQPAQMRRGDGEVFSAHVSGELIELEGEGYILGSVVDASAEAGQRRAEERLAAFFRSSPLAHSIVDFETNRYIEVNAAFERVFGIERAEAVGRTGAELGTWPEGADSRWYEVAAARPGEVVETRTRRRRRGGEAFDVAVSTTVVEVDGRLVRISSLRDVSEEARAEAALRVSEERLAAFLRTSPVAHSIYDLDAGRLVDVNAAWERMFGVSRAEALAAGTPAEGGWIDPDSLEHLTDALRRDGSLRDFPGRRRRRNGEVFDVRVSAELVVVGGVRFRITSLVDVSAEMRAREALERLAAYFRLSPAALVISRLADGVLVEVNEAYERMSGFNRAEVIGRTGIEVGIWGDAAARERMAAILREGKRVENMRLSIRHKSGSTVEVLFSSERVEFGGVAHIVTSAIDVTEQERARAALARSEERFSTFFHASPVALMISRQGDGYCLSANEAYARLMRTSPESVVGTTAAERNAWLADTARREFIGEVMAGGRASRRVRLRRRDGTQVEVQLSMVTLVVDGEPLLLVAYADLTQEVEALERLAVYFRLSPAALIISRLDDGTYIEVNEAYERMFGFRREEVVGRSSLERGVWGNPEERLQLAATLRAGGRVENRPLRVPRKDGTFIDVLFSAERMELEGVPHLLTSVVDVSEAERARRALAESEERFSRFFHSSPVAQVISEIDTGLLREVNDAWMGMTGYSREEAVGRTASELHLRVDPAMRDALVAQALSKGRIEQNAIKVRRKSGEIFDAIHAAELIELGGQRLMLTSVRDVSVETAARDALEARVRERTAELEASNRELESFSYSVSHDMRAPIRAIASYAEILRTSYGAALDDEARRILERIARAGGHLGGLVDALLDLSRLMRTSLERSPVDLSALATQILAGLRERDPGRSVGVVIEPGLTAQADPVLARSLLENLLGNAWKYTGRRAHARIEVGREGDAFYVRDNGVGFDMAYAGKLFKPFERLHRAGEFPGTGIGLATAERIVRRHHGALRAHAEPDRGATFWFTLPG